MGPPAYPWADRMFAPGPKRILAIDGGGVRGAVALGFLRRLETVLRQQSGNPALVLSDYFDLIGGTSVGAILAAGLALGLSADEAADRFNAMAPRLFKAMSPRLPLIQARFDPRILARLLRQALGDVTLGTAAWKTGFAAVAKRVDTGSSWVLTNCPRARYWGRGQDGGLTAEGYVPNADYDLAKVVQSSAAAPFFFDLVTLEVIKGEPGVFFDGAMTPHNNPALQMAMVALVPAYGLGWAPGAGQLMIVSVGTGGPRPRKPEWVGRRLLSVWKALHALVSMSYDTGELSTFVLQWLGASPQPWRLNSEVGDLSGARPAGHAPLWTVLRYDAPLERPWLEAELGLRLTDRQLGRMVRMDDVSQLGVLAGVGAAAAERQIRPEHFTGPFAPGGAG